MSRPYVLSKGTAISACASGNFIFDSDVNLILAKNKCLEVYLVKPEGVRLIKEIGLEDEIFFMKLYRPPGAQRDTLLLITRNGDIVFLRCQGDGHNFDVITKIEANRVSGCELIKEEVGAIVDPFARVMILQLVPWAPMHIQLEKCTDKVKLDTLSLGMKAIDLQFLHGCVNPTVILIGRKYWKDIKISLKVHEIQLATRYSCKYTLTENLCWEREIGEEATFLIPIPEPVCGAIVVQNQSISYHNRTTYVRADDLAIECRYVNCYARTEKRGTYLLGNSSGLSILKLDTDEDGTIVKVRVNFLGEVNTPESITYMCNELFFIRSKKDSQLVRIELGEKPSVRVIESFPNVDPITDMMAIDLQGERQIIICSDKRRSLGVIQNHIRIQEHAYFDLFNTKGIWALNTSSPEGRNDTIVLSFIGPPPHTCILTLHGEELEETDISEFQSDKQTLFCGNVNNELLIQVTSYSARLLCTRKKSLLSEWKPGANKTINVVACNGSQLVCAVRNELYYLELIMNEIVMKKSITLEHEISCLDMSPVLNTGGKNERSEFVALGLWTDISARVLKIPTLDQLCREQLEGEIIARSILMTVLEGMTYLLCALGDGSMFYFVMDRKTGKLSDRKKVTLGTRPIVLSTFRSLATTNVFACSDRPTVIYSSNHKLVFSGVNLKQVNYMCSLDADAYPNSLAMTTDNMVIIGTIDEIQKLHIRTIPLGEVPMRIAYQESSQTFGVLSMRVDTLDGGNVSHTGPSTSTQSQSTSEIEVHNLLIIHQNTFKVLHAQQLQPNEHALSLESCKLGDDPNHYYIIGTAFVNPEQRKREVDLSGTMIDSCGRTCIIPGKKKHKVGRIIVFLYKYGKLMTVTEQDVNGGCYSLVTFQQKLFAIINKTVQLFEWTSKKKLMKSTLDYSFERIQIGSDHDQIKVAKIMDGDTFINCASDSGMVILNIPKKESQHWMFSGEQVNVFRHGSLIMQHSGSTTSLTHGSILFSTVNGVIGLIMLVSPQLYEFLHLLQKRVRKVRQQGIMNPKFLRTFLTIGDKGPSSCINRDLVESFLDLPTEDMDSVAQSFKGKSQELAFFNDIASGIMKEKITANDIIELVEDLKRQTPEIWS